MRVTVTGGSGFIGKALVDYLANEGHEVTIFDISRPSFDLPPNVRYFDGDTRYVDDLLHCIAPGTDEVYDLAGVLGTSELNESPLRAIETNVIGCANVLKVCRIRDVPRIFRATKPNQWSTNLYSITKYAAECLAIQNVLDYGVSVAIARFFNAVGPAQKLYPIRKAVPLMAVQALRNLPLTVYGDGEQTVDLIWVGDIARIAVLATRHPTLGRSGKVLDVGSGEAITVNVMAQKIIEMCNSKSELVHLPMRQGEPLRSDIRADTTDLRKFIDFGTMMPLDEALRRTIDYYASLPCEEVDRALAHFERAAA